MKYNYTFYGIIHPERAKFSLGADIPLEIIFPDFGIDVQPTVTIQESKITVKLQSEIDHSKNEKCNLETLKNYVDEAVRLVVDIYCFVKSYNYDVEITKVECNELKIDYTYGVRGEWNIKKDEASTNEEYTRILILLSEHKNTFMKDVFADFRRAIKYPAMTASFCFRAIETIRKSVFEDTTITDDQQRRKDGWQKLRDALSYTEKDFEELLKFALPNRHGDYPTITYSQRESFMNFTRKVIERLIMHISK